MIQSQLARREQMQHELVYAEFLASYQQFFSAVDSGLTYRKAGARFLIVRLGSQN
mgnify:CR=1 FL=1